MKRFKYTLLVLFIGLFGCEDYLNESDDRGISQELVFSNYDTYKSVVHRATNLISNYAYNNADWECEVGMYSDELQDAQTGKTVGGINAGIWKNANVRDFSLDINRAVSNEFQNTRWSLEPAPSAFIAIRAINIALNRFDSLTIFPDETGYSEEELKDQLLGQCHYLRAWHYFEIIRRYGGFPILKTVLKAGDDFDVERPTYLESTKELVMDLDKAIEHLPERWNDIDKGRPTKTTAKALKAMALLYAASPNMNADLQYNKQVCIEAADAAAEAIKSAESGSSRYAMFSKENYSENWYSLNGGISDEAIFQPPMSQRTSPQGNWEVGVGWNMPKWDGGWAVGGYPTQNSVDWFETSTGWDINDTGADFDPTDPYSNRDPRLKINVFCHGDKMYIKNNKTLEAHYEGKQAESMSSLIWTGYAVAGKHRWPGANKFDKKGGYYRLFPLIRFAQLYLDYAEAVNEAYGPMGSAPGSDLTAVDAINIVRTRIGMPNVLDKYTVDTETFRARIYNERAVELYQEFHRWPDIRRWRIAKDVLKEIRGATVEKVGSKFVYGSKFMPDAIRVFEDKHYWYPFTTKQINMFSKFKQNPGW